MNWNSFHSIRCTVDYICLIRSRKNNLKNDFHSLLEKKMYIMRGWESYVLRFNSINIEMYAVPIDLKLFTNILNLPSEQEASDFEVQKECEDDTYGSIQVHNLDVWSDNATESVINHEISSISIAGRLSTLPESFGKTDLINLVLSGPSFKVFPSSVCDIKRLSCLNLYSTNIRAIPPEIKYLSQLNVFSLTHSRVKTIPVELCELRGLIKLNLKSNFLKSVPSKLANLRVLYELNLSLNSLRYLPKGIVGNYEREMKIDLSQNRIERIPNDFKNLSQESSLKLIGNKLKGKISLGDFKCGMHLWNAFEK